jgi:hypothetical protein
MSLKSGKAHVQALKMGFSTQSLSLNNSFFGLECKKLEATLKFDSIEIPLPAKMRFSLKNDQNSLSIDINDKTVVEISETLVKSFESNILNNSLLLNHFHFSGDCSGRSEKIIKKLLWSLLEKELSKAGLKESFAASLNQVLNKNYPVNEPTLEKFFQTLPHTSLDFEAFWDSSTQALQIQTQDFDTDLETKRYLSRSQKVALHEGKTWIYTDTQSVQSLLKRVFEFQGFLKSGFELVQNSENEKGISYLVKLGWSVDKLRLFNPLFRTLPRGRFFDIQLVSRSLDGKPTLPELRPFKSQGGFKMGFDFTAPIWMVFQDTENQEILGEQYLGEMSITLDIKKDKKSGRKMISVLEALVRRDDNIEGVPQVPDDWVDTLNWSISQTTRTEKASLLVVDAQQNLSPVVQDVLESLNFVVIPSEESKREMSKDSYYARGIVFKF